MKTFKMKDLSLKPRFKALIENDSNEVCQAETVEEDRVRLTADAKDLRYNRSSTECLYRALPSLHGRSLKITLTVPLMIANYAYCTFSDCKLRLLSL